MYNYFNSPFGAVIEKYDRVLPPALKEHFLVDADANYNVVLEGKLDRIWYRPKWLLPVYWFLAKTGILLSNFGDSIPTTLTVIGHRGANGTPRHHWNRTFRFSDNKKQHFNATIVYDPASNRAIDRLGPNDIILMAWDVFFKEPETLELITSGWGLKIGKSELWLPAWFWRTFFVKVVAMEKADMNRTDTIHIDLTIEQHLLGKIFGYEGTFRMIRKAK